MGEGEMGEGNGIRPVHCKGCPTRRLRRRVGQCVYPWPLWNKWNFRLFHLFHSGLWMSPRWFAAIRYAGFRPLMICDSRALRAFLKKLKILN
jgi:hypothetical protein